MIALTFPLGPAERAPFLSRRERSLRLRKVETPRGRSVRLLTAFLFLGLTACETQRSFNSPAWKQEAGKMPSDSIRSSMTADLERQYPHGTPVAAIERALGPSEGSWPDICAEKGADQCLFYYSGASGVDPIVYVIGFRSDRSVAYWKREL